MEGDYEALKKLEDPSDHIIKLVRGRLDQVGRLVLCILQFHGY